MSLANMGNGKIHVKILLYLNVDESPGDTCMIQITKSPGSGNGLSPI